MDWGPPCKAKRLYLVDIPEREGNPPRDVSKLNSGPLMKALPNSAMAIQRAKDAYYHSRIQQIRQWREEGAISQAKSTRIRKSTVQTVPPVSSKAIAKKGKTTIYGPDQGAMKRAKTQDEQPSTSQSIKRGQSGMVKPQNQPSRVDRGSRHRQSSRSERERSGQHLRRRRRLQRCRRHALQYDHEKEPHQRVQCRASLDVSP